MLALIIISLVALSLVYGVTTVKPKPEYTEWEHHRDTTPLVTALPNGEGVFQNQSHWVRFNNRTQTWETKLVIDPVQRPFNEATSLTDVYNLSFR